MVLTSFVARYSAHSNVTASLHSFCVDDIDKIDCICLNTARAVLRCEIRASARPLARPRSSCQAQAHTTLNSCCSRGFSTLIASTSTLWQKMPNSASKVWLAKGLCDSTHCLQIRDNWVRFKKFDGDDSRMGVNKDIISF